MPWKVEAVLKTHDASRSISTELDQLASDIGGTHPAGTMVITAQTVYLIDTAANALARMGLFVNPYYFEAL
jgi:hypothetical protein